MRRGHKLTVKVRTVRMLRLRWRSCCASASFALACRDAARAAAARAYSRLPIPCGDVKAVFWFQPLAIKISAYKTWQTRCACV